MSAWIKRGDYSLGNFGPMAGGLAGLGLGGYAGYKGAPYLNRALLKYLKEYNAYQLRNLEQAQKLVEEALRSQHLYNPLYHPEQIYHAGQRVLLKRMAAVDRVINPLLTLTRSRRGMAALGALAAGLGGLGLGYLYKQ